MEKHVTAVFKDTLDNLDWEGRVAVMRALLQRLKPHLPPNISEEPPERFVEKCDQIARVYVESTEGVKQLMRAL